MQQTNTQSIINLNNTTHKTGENRLILGEQLGLKDTINIHHPKLLELFDSLKAQDWKEDELSFTQDRIDLLKASKEVKDLFKFNIVESSFPNIVVGEIPFHFSISFSCTSNCFNFNVCSVI